MDEIKVNVETFNLNHSSQLHGAIMQIHDLSAIANANLY
jgi:hypothetical protein